ncbi:MAG: methyltransferase domain-containing protein [Patescibacteria group bacterium]
MKDKHKIIHPPTSDGYWDPQKQEPLVEEVTRRIHSGTALDIGAGYVGRDSFFLADLGFDVTATEVDDECLLNLRILNDNRDKLIKIVKGDIRTYETKVKFDIVISDMVLHFLDAPEIVPAVRRIQDYTNTGGFNVITAYTAKNPAGKRPYLFSLDELLEYYDGWKIIQYTEKPTPWFKLPDEPKARRNEAVYLLAQKI